MTEKEAKKFLGKYCEITWIDHSIGEEGSVIGTIVEVTTRFVTVASGYSVWLPAVTTIKEVEEHHD